MTLRPQRWLWPAVWCAAFAAALVPAWRVLARDHAPTFEELVQLRCGAPVTGAASGPVAYRTAPPPRSAPP